MAARAWETLPKEPEWGSRGAGEQASSFLEISAKESPIQMEDSDSSFQIPDRGEGWYVILRVLFSPEQRRFHHGNTRKG